MEEQMGQNPAPSPESLERGYETTDVRFSGLWGFLIVSVIVMVGIFLLVAATLHHTIENQRMADRPRSSVITSQLPPAPQIQPIHGHDVLPYQDLEDMHRQEDAVFQKLGWKADPNTHAIVMADDVVDQVRKMESQLASGAARTQPTVGPAGANTINAGPPTTQTTTGTSLSPQGPGGTMERRATTRPAGREPK
jgi:hypothetical protein